MPSDRAKKNAARAALALVEPGMRLGLGTGSTSAHFVRMLGERVRDGLAIEAIASSKACAALAKSCGIELSPPEGHIDLTIDGADEYDARLRLIKGGGGALLREKMLAAASRRVVIIVDAGKRVDVLGRFPLPVEVVPFGVPLTLARLDEAAGAAGIASAHVTQRRDGTAAVRTDNGNWVVDIGCSRIPEPEVLAAHLDAVPGVVAHGLFIDMAERILVGDTTGLRTVLAQS